MSEDHKGESPLKKMFRRWEETKPKPKNYDLDLESTPVPQNAITGKPKTESELDEETAREMARILAALEDEIIEIATKSKINRFDSPPSIIMFTENGILIRLKTKRLKSSIGEEVDHISLSRYNGMRNDWQPIHVNSDNHLEITGNVNEDNKEKYVDYIKSGKPANFWTDYFVDNQGNYGKVERVPKDFDNRGELISNYRGAVVKVIEGKMTPNDFELVQTALTLLKEALTSGDS